MSLSEEKLQSLTARIENRNKAVRRRSLILTLLLIIGTSGYLVFTLWQIQIRQKQLQQLNKETQQIEKKLQQAKQKIASQLSLLEDLKQKNNLPKVQQKLASTVQTGDIASQNERLGFLALLNGNLTEARAKFKIAYDAFPTYHNVDEIYHVLLTEDRVKQYNQANEIEKKAIEKQIFQAIVTNYSWGAPPDLLSQIKAKL
jgi:hypothetical protein